MTVSDSCLAKTDRGYSNWTTKRRMGRRKVTKSIAARDVNQIEAAWHFARLVGMPLNRLITFCPRNIDSQMPEQRINTWTRWRNRLAQFARDNNFEFKCIWTRESQRGTGTNEHMHVLMHVPPKLLLKFDEVVRGWPDHPEEIDCRPASYRTKTTSSGKRTNVMTYVTKNSPQAAYTGTRIYQPGGPILGKRFGMSRNLAAPARSRAEVRNVLRREFRLPIAPSGVTACAPHKVRIPVSAKFRRKPLKWLVK